MTGRISLLGRFQIAVDSSGGGRTIHRKLATRKAEALVAALALAPEKRHHRDTLASALWPDSLPDDARHSLRQALASVRKQLGPEFVIADGREFLRLGERIDVDTQPIRDALARRDFATVRALTRDAGPLLDGFFDDLSVAARDDWETRLAQIAESEPADAGPKPTTFARAFPMTSGRFFGREADVAACVARLRETHVRLVTLTGAGGLGKTRLAVEILRALAPNFDGPLTFVACADLSSPDELDAAVASTLELVGIVGHDAPAILCLDNLEHLPAPQTARTIQKHLETAPNLTILATSRRALRVAFEDEFPLAPLPLPAVPGNPDRIREFASVALLLDRARAAGSDVSLTERNAVPIGALCRALDGIPLAIELAAARLKAHSPAEIIDALSDRFAFLASADPTRPDRHQTLFAAIEGSVAPLPDTVRNALFDLAAFHGGATRDAARFVLGPHADTHLETLAAHSLVRFESRAARFSQLPTIVEFARKTAPTDDLARARRRHASFFLTLAESQSGAILGADAATAIRVLDADWENLRAACDSDDPETREKLASVLAVYFLRRGRLHDGKRILSNALAPGDFPNGSPQEIARRSRICDALGAICSGRGEFDEAEAALRTGLALRRVSGDSFAIARSLLNLGTLALDRDRPGDAEALFSEALERARDSSSDLLTAIALGNFGVAALHKHDYDRALALFDETLALRRKMDDPIGIGVAQINRASAKLALGAARDALEIARDSVRRLHEAGERTQLLAAATGYAQARISLGDTENGVVWLGAIESERAALGAPIRAADARELERFVLRAKEILGETAFAKRFQDGVRGGLSTALAADFGTPSDFSQPSGSLLTPL